MVEQRFRKPQVDGSNPSVGSTFHPITKGILELDKMKKRSEKDHPTAEERFFFDTNGYLLIEEFLTRELVADLIQASRRAIEHRRQRQTEGTFRDGEAHFAGANARIFGLLEDDPLFLDMMDYPPVMPYVRALLNPEPNYHASDVIWEVESPGTEPHWHRDGRDDGFSLLRPRIPHLQLKVGYFLSDMLEPDRGNLTIVPGSHHATVDPPPDQLAAVDSMPGSMQLCAPAGTCVMFHNAIWHTPAAWTASGGERIVLYCAYEHPWMMAANQARYSRGFYQALSPERKKMFHKVVFEVA